MSKYIKYIDEGDCPWCKAHIKFLRYGPQFCAKCGKKIDVSPDVDRPTYLNFLTDRTAMRGSDEIAALTNYIQELNDSINEISGSYDGLISGAKAEIELLIAKKDLLISFK